MKRVIAGENRLPVKMWLDDVEEGAMKQIVNLANLPFAFKHIAIMPDCHFGYGMPIGGVMATENVIIPNAVGVDIGCGMCAVNTNIKRNELEEDILKKIMGKIRENIPVGNKNGRHKERQEEILMPKKDVMSGYNTQNDYPIIHREYYNALKQLGTLGGGNHFIEIQVDTEDNIWIMIHSGSRNLGKRVADYHNRVAINMNTRWYSKVPKELELAFLPIETEEGKCYKREMEYCVEFAYANRRLMMDRVIDCVWESVDTGTKTIAYSTDMINIAHNYATFENHFGRNVIIHRKGATLAREGTIGIIPGSQGTKSYIVKGLGNPESFMSCSHGAGRLMGRRFAKNNLNLEEEIKKLNEQGVIHGVRSSEDLDEAPGAYKDIDVVMENQKDLVEIVTELKPLAVIKG